MNPQEPMNQPGVAGQDQAPLVVDNDQNTFAASAPNAGSPQPVVQGVPSQPESVAAPSTPQPLNNSPASQAEQPPAPSIAQQQAQLNQELNKHPLFQDQPAATPAEPVPTTSPVDQSQPGQAAPAMPLYNQPAPSDPAAAVQTASQQPPVDSVEQPSATSPIKSIVIGIGIAVVIIAIIIAAILLI